MTILHAASDLSIDDLHAAVDHFIKRVSEMTSESDEVKEHLKQVEAQLARVQHHVVVVDAVNQAQAREIDGLKAERRRSATRERELAEKLSARDLQVDQLQRDNAQLRAQNERREKWHLAWPKHGNRF